MLPRYNKIMATSKLKTKVRHWISFLLHGESKPLYANITYLQPNERLEGKRIIVTGGGRGLGFAMAKRFVAEGAEVLIAGRNEEMLKKSADELSCKYLRLDVREVGTFQEFFDKAEKLMGKINCLVNNAAISLHEENILSVSQEQFEAQINTNFRGPYFLAKEFMERCSEDTADIKNILFVSSETGTTADERPYGLTKAAINSLVQGLAHKYVNKGFRVNAVAPGVTISDMVGKKNDGDLTCEYNLTKRYYLPEEVAEVACFLLSDASNCLNGQILVCNEGKTINARWK